MLNFYQTKCWKNIIHKHDENDWINISCKAIKKENKRKSWINTMNKSNKLQIKKIKCINDSMLSRYLIEWEIKPSKIFLYEMNNITFTNWKILIGLRSGHNYLNDQRKYYKYGHDHNCVMDNCNYKETTLHFLLLCDERNDTQQIMLDKICDIYKEEQIDITNMQPKELLYHILFPFNEKLKDKKIREDKVKRKYYYNKRIQVLNELFEYCYNTERFKNCWTRNYSTW